MPAPPRLLERDRELEVLTALAAEAASGHGGVIVVEGDPGAGKTALVGALGGAAQSAGLRTLSAIGGELEREYPFGVVRQLFELELAGADPARRERLLSGAAATVAPLVGAGPVANLVTGQDASFSTLHGLYWLTAALAEERPLLLTLDDAHWSDAPSLRFLDFLARRIAELPLLIALAARPQEPGAETELLDAIAEADAATVLRPGSLSSAAVAELIGERLGDRIETGVAAAAHLATGGNPLLLSELLAALGDGAGPITAATVKDAVPSSVTRSVGRRLKRLPAPTLAVVEALATLSERDGPELLAAVSGLPFGAFEAALVELREVGLLERESVRFVHPLIRQAVAQRIQPGRRHRLHAAAARALHERGGSLEEVIVHLLAAPPLGEEWAAATLLEGGRRALAEGAPEAAVSRLERAAEESRDAIPEELALELGRAKLNVGDPTALADLEAAASGGDPRIAAEALASQIAVESLTVQRPRIEVAERVRAAAERLGDDAPAALLNPLIGSIAVASSIDGSLISRRDELYADPRFRELPVVTGTRAWLAACGEAPREQVLELARLTLRNAPLTELAQIENPHSFWSIAALAFVDEAAEAEAVLAEAETAARLHGSRLAHAFVALARAQIAIAYGSVALGEAGAREATPIWREMGLPTVVQTTIAQTVWALALRSRVEEAEALLPEVGEPVGLFPRGQLLLARATLRSAQRRHAEAAADLRELQESIAPGLSLGQFGVGFTRASLAEALIANGEVEEGAEIAREEVAGAEAANRPSRLVAGLVALAGVGEGEAQIELLRRACEVGAARTPLVRAKARIALGAALRRRGQRKEAREHLREGQEIAGRASLRALEQQALDELVVAGGRPRSPYSSGVEALTPSELRVAKQAASGLTNREIAEALFVTRKTVELHLGNAYGKLGIRSRAQLPEALDEGIEGSGRGGGPEA